MGPENSGAGRTDGHGRSDDAGRQRAADGGNHGRCATDLHAKGRRSATTRLQSRSTIYPLNGRQVSNLFTLTPGVEGGQGGRRFEQNGANPRTNGMMVGSTEMLLDGISYVDRFGGGISRVQPGLDTMQEYKVETAGSSAQYDRPATIELVTRSGTNQFHGALFETLRNNVERPGVPRARQDGNTPGKVDPQRVRRIRRRPDYQEQDVLFYDQEFLRQREQVFAQTAVPTEAMWNGDFSNAVDTSGNKITIYNPYTIAAPTARAIRFRATSSRRI